MMRINLAIIIVLSMMVAVLWCSKCGENFGVGNFDRNTAGPMMFHGIEDFIGGNFNSRRINSDARRGPGTGKHDTRILFPSGWAKYKPVFKEGFAGWAEIQATHDPEGFSGGRACGF